jgi:hypothetical protein
MRLWLGAGLALALAALGWLGYRTAYQSGYEAATAAVRAEWYLERAKAAEAATAALRAAVERHQEVERGLTDKLDAADRRGRDLAGRLRDARAAPGVPGACPDAAPPDGPAGEPQDAGGLGAALADHLAACERDAARFAELQALSKD